MMVKIITQDNNNPNVQAFCIWMFVLEYLFISQAVIHVKTGTPIKKNDKTEAACGKICAHVSPASQRKK